MTDVLIIGAGIAGMTAAVVSSNAGLSVRLIDKTGLAMSANDFSCFSSIPFFNGLTPLNICEILAKDIEKCGIELTPAKAVSVSKGEDSFKVMCDIGDFFSRAVIISAGKQNSISYPNAECHPEIDESCRLALPGLMLCGNARREAGLLRCMADGLVCGETAAEWVKSKFYA